jgi:uncharacterized membrane protein
VSQKRAKQSRKAVAQRDQPAPAKPARQTRQEEMFPEAIEVSRTSIVSGPIPDPKTLAEYEQAFPGLAALIVAMAEEEGRARRSNNSRLIRLSELGLISAFIIAMTAIGGGIFLAYEGRPTEGVVAIVGALAALTAVFVVGKVVESRE